MSSSFARSTETRYSCVCALAATAGSRQLSDTSQGDVHLADEPSSVQPGHQPQARDRAPQRTAQRAREKEPEIGPVQLHISSRGRERIVPYDGRMVIGTAETCTVRLQDPYASGQHALIEQCSATHFHP
jgi:hypothetical protein